MLNKKKLTNITESEKKKQLELEIEFENKLNEDLEKELELIIANKPIIDIKLSYEQELITNLKSNVIVDAVAGSGKTTTILHMSLNYPDKNIFQITYNNMLKKEVRKKINRLSINNMHIHTYHSLGVKYYNEYAYTDEELKKILINNTHIRKEIINDIIPIDILFIDESQDMIYDYYKLIKKFISDTKSNPQIIILGDRYQGIYDFRGADIKFLTLADKIWNLPFEKVNLSISYRLTNQIGWFINNIMLNNQRIKTIKSGPVVDYYIANPYEIYKKIGKYIRKAIETENILPSDIFILIPSVKSLDSPYKKLENYLVKYGIKCTTPSSDEAKLDEKVISNKVVFTTYHQAKGRERKIVILYNFDDSYTQYYNKEHIDIKQCPNVLYVGVTRASWKLILIQDFRNKPLQFLNISKMKTNLNLNVEIIDNYSIQNKTLNNDKIIKKISVTDMVKFINSNTIDILMELIEKNNLFIQIKKAESQINIPNKIKIDNNIQNNVIWEDISDLNGLVIPAIYETKILNSTSTIENYVKSHMTNKLIWNDIKKYIGKINIPASNPSDFLKIGNIYLSIQNKLHAKLAQIKKYNWLDLKLVKECHNRMDILSPNTNFEIPISNSSDEDYIEYFHNDFGSIHIKGRLDAIDENNVWEFKCVDNITIEHKLQIIIYYWLWNLSILKEKYGNKNFLLFNIKSGQIIQLNIEKDFIINEIVKTLFQEKFLSKKKLNEQEFIDMCT